MRGSRVGAVNLRDGLDSLSASGVAPVAGMVAVGVTAGAANRNYGQPAGMQQLANVVDVRRVLGPSGAALNTYSHLWPSAEDWTRRASAALMGEVLADSPPTQRTEQTSD